MQELMEFRIPENKARLYLEPSLGVILGDSVRKVVVATDDPLCERIRNLDREFQEKSDGEHFFFHGWDIRRRYTKAELRAAEAFTVKIKRTFEPPGELCGTVYDESTACPRCGAGATQASDLRLDLRKAPRGVDIARTIADEMVVSQSFAEWLIDGGFRGFELRRVRHKARYEDDPFDLHRVPTGREILRRAERAGAPHPTGAFWIWLNRLENRHLADKARQENAALKRRASRARGKPLPVWHQLVPTGTVEILPPTKAGISPSQDDAKGEFRCPRGDTIGLAQISELWVSRRDFENYEGDIVFTKQCIGLRNGLLRPSPKLLISPRLWRALQESELKGLDIEVAHLK